MVIADGDAAAAATPASDLERVGDIKGRLNTLCTHETELDVELCARNVQLSEQQAVWERAQAAHLAAVEPVAAKREAVLAEIKVVKSELVAAINAPVSGGRDPTEWLPDELMLMVLERVPFATLWSGACERACQRC